MMDGTVAGEKFLNRLSIPHDNPANCVAIDNKAVLTSLELSKEIEI